MNPQLRIARDAAIMFLVSLLALWSTAWLFDFIAWSRYASSCPVCYTVQAGESWTVGAAVGVITFGAMAYVGIRARLQGLVRR